MTKEQIQNLVDETISTPILITDAEINEYNNQIDKLTIILKPDAGRFIFKEVGELIDKIDNLTIEDGYGDLTEFEFEWTSYHIQEPDEMTERLIITFNIDS